MRTRVILFYVILILGILALSFIMMIPGCSDSEPDSSSNSGETIDLAAGKDAACFNGLDAEILTVEIIRQGETFNFEFEGVSLDVLLANAGISEFTKIELAISDMDENMDITDIANAPAGVFVAWSESGEPETPARVFPKDAATGNLLTRNVTSVIITK